MNLAEYYNTVIDLSHGIVVTVDEKGRIVHGNAHFERISGYHIRELAGVDWFETFVDETRRDQARARFLAIVRGGGLASAKGALRDKSGRDVFIDWNLKPLFMASGDVLSVLCVGVDVTAHVQRQRNLRHEHDRLVVLNKELTCLHAMNRLVANTDGTLTEVLHEVLRLIPPAFQYPEATGVRLVLDGQGLSSDRYAPESATRLVEDVEVHRVKRGHLSVSLDGRDRHGGPRAFLPTERELLGALAKHVGWIIAKREALVTKRNLERQLQHADRLAKIGQFAAGVAHELNEPLANILGFAQLAAKAPGLPEQVGRDLENIVKSALHSREVIKKLMLFSRQVPLRKALVSLNQIIRDALYFTEMSATRNHVRIDLDLAEDVPAIWGDPQHLKQVVVNLVVNAIHAMPTGGTLSMQTSSFKNDVYLLVSDTGVGMGPEVLRQIFNPFFTTKEVDQGTGLGLAVVHGIVTAHGGVIEVHSVEGQGTRVEIAFPCSATAPGHDE
ncbi:MAG: PAS domain S-box protein [Deltaproteobacteria bacterium]|nr:PAS domain S-box protein [Deltaproteobacteria bacterium]